MTASDVINLLKLEPLEKEGGWFKRTWTSRVPGAGSCIYYFMDRAAGEFSCLHVLDQDETFHFYGGSPAEMFLFYDDGTFDKKILGMNLSGGERPQIVVPAGTVQGTRVKEEGGWSLLGTSMAPEFHWKMFQLPDIEALVKAFPAQHKIIAEMASKS